MANQCNPGYQVEGNRCVPKQNTLGNVQRSTNFNNSQIGGFLLITIAIGLYLYTPKQQCSWYNLICHAQNQAFTSTLTLVSIALLIVGIWFLFSRPNIPRVPGI